MCGGGGGDCLFVLYATHAPSEYNRTVMLTVVSVRSPMGKEEENPGAPLGTCRDPHAYCMCIFAALLVIYFTVLIRY